MPDGTDMPRCERELCVDGLTAWHKWSKAAEKKNKTIKEQIETIRLWRLWREHETQIWERQKSRLLLWEAYYAHM
jgi:hypothetical protein